MALKPVFNPFTGQFDFVTDPGSLDTIEIGAVQPFRFTPSSQWLPLEGGTFNVDDYPLLGPLYGGVPGGTFAVDDFRGRAVYAADGSSPSGTLAGSDTVDLTHAHGAGSLANAAAADHTHAVGSLATAAAGSHDHGGVTGATGSKAVGTLSLLATAAPPNHTHTIPIEAAHSHTVSGDTATGGAHNHAISGSVDNGLGATDKRAARGYLRLFIRAR